MPHKRNKARTGFIKKLWPSKKSYMPIVKIRNTAIEGRKIPDFELNNRETILLLIDSVESEFLLSDYLTGKKKHFNIEIFEPIQFVEYQPYKLSLWERTLGHDLVRHVVKRQLKCSDEKIDEILEKAQIGRHWRYTRLAGNPRRTLATLLALEKGYSIIYTIAGMDPMGADYLHKLVKDEIMKRNVGAIELNTNYSDGERNIPNADKIIKINRPGHNNRIKQAPFQLRKK